MYNIIMLYILPSWVTSHTFIPYWFHKHTKKGTFSSFLWYFNQKVWYFSLKFKMRFELAPTKGCSSLIWWFLAKRMQPIIMQEGTTPSERNRLHFFQIKSNFRKVLWFLSKGLIVHASQTLLLNAVYFSKIF